MWTRARAVCAARAFERRSYTGEYDSCARPARRREHGFQTRPVSSHCTDDGDAANCHGGGLQEFADSKKILSVRTESGKQMAKRFNDEDVRNGKNLNQNIELQPGDTVVVP